MNEGLDKLREVNPLYRGVWIDETLKNVSKENEPLLANLLTNENAENYKLQTDSDDNYNVHKNTKNSDYSESDPILRHWDIQLYWKT